MSMAMEYQLAPTFSKMDEMDLGGNTKCIENNQTIIIRMIIVKRNVRRSNVAILANIYRGALCDLDLFITVLGDKTTFGPSGEEFW